MHSKFFPSFYKNWFLNSKENMYLHLMFMFNGFEWDNINSQIFNK